MRPKIFIGSSTEGLKFAQAIQVLLDKICEVQIWSQGVFGLGRGTLDSLVLSLDNFDFAIFVLTPDDMTVSREQTTQSPRDNVLFELGLFVGGIGRDRTFIVHDREKQIKIPSDLAGITLAQFQEHGDGNLLASLGAAATPIQNAVQKLGIRATNQLEKLGTATAKVFMTSLRSASVSLNKKNTSHYLAKAAGDE
jgi:predicted nucleotide-binding protein